jgi:MoxR-like ATPase
LDNRYLTEEEVGKAHERLQRLRDQLNQVLFGQEQLIDLVITGLLARGHILLEGLPGLGKTQLVKGLSRAIGLSASRVQFTPDLLPGDVTGNPILQEVDGTRKFVFQQGPLFANLVLADEINRASPKTQSALLEAMQERHVTVMGTTHPLPKPFFVLATQNPIELEGTYPLPEAQLDRFLFKLEVHRSSTEVLQKIIGNREIGIDPEVDQVIDPEAFDGLIGTASRVYLPDVVANYVARLVNGTHHGESKAAAAVKYGASPRAALALAAGAKARAVIAGRTNASFEDVQDLAAAVLRHRIVLDYRAKLDGATADSVVAKLLAEIPTQGKEIPGTLAEAS